MPDKVRRVAIETLRPNPDNPRVIHDDKLQKLVESVRAFPEMLELRPLVVTSEYVVLGGNQRLKACQLAGLTEVPVVVADTLTPEQQREFIIKDNVAFGEWNWDTLTTQWDTAALIEWGLSETALFTHHDTAPERDIDLSHMSQSAESYLNNSIRQIVLHYDKDTHANVLSRLSEIGATYNIENDNSATVLALLEFWDAHH
jgi:hypothetical protein